MQISMEIEAPPSKFDFDSIAGEYDRWYEKPEGAMYDRLEKRAVERFLPKERFGKKLLDIGCGTGHWSRFFGHCGFNVTGIDVSAAMIEIAKSRKTFRTSFQQGDAHKLPFMDSAFDVAAIITVLEFARDPEKIIFETIRCLKKPGGVLIVGVLNDLAAVNRKRKHRRQRPSGAARFFSPGRIRNLLSAYGKTRLLTTGFVPHLKPLLPTAPMVNRVAELMRLPQGPFIAGKVDL